MPVDCVSVGVLVADHLCAPISHMPAPGELVLADHLLLTIGGCASNAAVDMCRLGIKVAVAGCVGNDSFGSFITDTLAAAGADTTSVKRLTDVGTSGTLIINVVNQDRRFVHTMGANARLTAADIPWERVQSAKVLYVGGYLLMPALRVDELTPLFRRARAAGVTTVLDVVLPGKDDYWPRLEMLLPEVDVFLPNDDEARLITGQEDPKQQALQFQSAGAKTVVITCGGRGTILVHDKLRMEADTYPVTYVGGTGAGDAFDAGYIAGILARGDPETCLKWGSALGASCVRSIGATDSVFTREEALDFMRRHTLRIRSW